jgi:hypothetical protein
MDVPRLGIVDLECMISAVHVCFIFQISVKRRNMFEKMQGKFRYIGALSLATEKFLPRREQIFYGYDILISMIQAPLTLSLSLSLSKTPRYSSASKRDICCG